jgi:putative inorganic carbon (HCO3(-)) transporter
MDSVSPRLMTGKQAILYVSISTIVVLIGLAAWLWMPRHLIIFGALGTMAALAGLMVFAFPKYGLFVGLYFVYAGLLFYTSLPVPAVVTFIVTAAVGVRLLRGDPIMVRDPLFLWSLALFVMFALQSMLFAYDHAYAMYSFIAFTKSVLLIFLLGQLIRTERDLNALALVIFAATLSSAVLGAVNNTLGIYHEAQSILPGASWQRFSATHLNANRAAHFFVAGLPLGVYAVKRARSHIAKSLLVAGVVALVLATILTFSRQTIFPLIVVLLAVLFREARSKWVYAVVGAVVLIGLFFVPGMYWHRITTIATVFDETSEDWSLAMRIRAFNAAWRMFLDHPLTGVGLNNFIVRSGLFVKIGAHNGYLEVLTGVGLFGFIAFMLMHVAGIRGHLRAIRTRWPVDRSWMSDLAYYFLLSTVAVLVSIFFEQTHFDRVVWLPVAAGLVAARLARETRLPEKKLET